MLAALEASRTEPEPFGGAECPLVNWLTDAAHGDPLTATPHHKVVRVRIRPAEPLAKGRTAHA
jgi:hypothetical protein